jgi:lysozyme
MKTSARGLTVIKEFEGKRLEAYLCPAGEWTIGYGHTSAAGTPKVMPEMRITDAEAYAILQRDVVAFEMAVSRLVKKPLNQGQFDALVSFIYNVGAGAFEKSTLLKRINAGRFDDVPAQLMRWTKGGGRELPGLVRRRRAEAALWRSLFEGPVAETAGKGDVAKVEQAPGPEKAPAGSGSFWSIIVSIFTGGGLTGLTGINNVWSFLAVALPITVLAVLAFMIWTGRIQINRGPA